MVNCKKITGEPTVGKTILLSAGFNHTKSREWRIKVRALEATSPQSATMNESVSRRENLVVLDVLILKTGVIIIVTYIYYIVLIQELGWA